MDYITRKYINLISGRLTNFAWKNYNLAICKCPLCGDSKKRKRVRRGNFFTYKGEDFYNCYNCGEPQGFGFFLKKFDPNLYREYRLEVFKEHVLPARTKDESEDDFDESVLKLKSSKKPTPKETTSTVEINKELVELNGYKKLSELNPNHPARQFAIDRALEDYLDRIYYIVDFPSFSSSFNGLESWSKIEKHSRMLFPCVSPDDKCLTGFSARAFLDDYIRYCTWKDSDYQGKTLYGLDTVDISKTVYVVEGVIDSLMIDNAVAVMSSALNSVDMIGGSVLIFDNQPRSKEIVKLVSKAIEDKRTVVIWPENFPAKDLNEAVTDHGFTKESLMDIIIKNTYSGLKAELQFRKWKRV